MSHNLEWFKGMRPTMTSIFKIRFFRPKSNKNEFSLFIVFNLSLSSSALFIADHYQPLVFSLASLQQSP